jgi:uncharacterized protein (DUF2141 family)
MSNKPLSPAFKPIFTAALALTLSAMTTSSRSLAEPRVTEGNLIEFLTYVRGSQGVVLCGLFEQQGWLKRTVQPSRAKIVNGRALCVFRNVTPGTYGISAFHDANENGKLDTNFLGMPTEDYCASRNARGIMGPPSFSDAKFNYKGNVLRLAVSMK